MYVLGLCLDLRGKKMTRNEGRETKRSRETQTGEVAGQVRPINS